MRHAERARELEDRLRVLEPSSLEVIDESHLHVGHPGSEGGASHFRIVIASPRFEGLTPVARHRLVYEAVGDLIPFPIHALAIEATPA